MSKIDSKITVDLEPLKKMDKVLDEIKEALVDRNTLEVSDNDMIVLKSINNKYQDIISLINYLARNQNELCKKTSIST